MGSLFLKTVVERIANFPFWGAQAGGVAPCAETAAIAHNGMQHNMGLCCMGGGGDRILGAMGGVGGEGFARVIMRQKRGKRPLLKSTDRIFYRKVRVSFVNDIVN